MIVGALVLLMTGCGAAKPSYSAEYKAAFEKRVGADEPRARAFVDKLATLPAAQRMEYVRRNFADARNLAKIPDQDLQARYRSVMKSKN